MAANDLIKEIEKRFKETGIRQVKKGTGKQERDKKKQQNNQNKNKSINQ